MTTLMELSSGLTTVDPVSGPISRRPGSATNGVQHAAGEFESILLNQWLEGAESSFGSVPGGDDEQDAGDAQMKSFAVQALARGITAAGGIGLSSLVSRALEAHTTPPALTTKDPQAR